MTAAVKLPHAGRVWSIEIRQLAREQADDRAGGSRALVALEQTEPLEVLGIVSSDWRACHCGAAMPPTHEEDSCAACQDADEFEEFHSFTD